MKTKHLAVEFDSEEFIRATKRPRLEGGGPRPGAVTPQFSDNLLMLAQTALSSCEDQTALSSCEDQTALDSCEDQTALGSCEDHSFEGSRQTFAGTLGLIQTDGATVQTAGHMTKPTAFIHPYKPGVVLGLPSKSCELITEEDHSAKSVRAGNIKEQPSNSSSFTCKADAQGLQMLAQTALSTSVPLVNSNSECSATTSDHGDGPQTSRLERVLLGLHPISQADQPHSGAEQTTQIDNSLPAKARSSRRKSGVPRRRIQSDSLGGTQASPENKSRETSSSKRMQRKRCGSRSYDYMDDEPVPIKNVKMDTTDSKADKAPIQIPYRPRPRQYLLPRLRSSPSLYNSLITNWKEQLDDWKARNRAIDSKDAHKMKYPSHLHEWLERVKFSHTRKWKVFDYEEPKWTTEQLALTGRPGSSSAA